MIEVSLLFNPVSQQKNPSFNSRTGNTCGATLFDPLSQEPSLQSANTLLSRNAGTASQILALHLPNNGARLSPRPQEPIILILHLPGFHRPGFAVRP